jgi:hypothetical protein
MSQDVPARMAGARTLHIMSYQNDNHETIHPCEERSVGSALSDIAEQPMLTRYAYVITKRVTVTSDNGPIGGMSILAHATQDNIHKLNPNACFQTMLVLNKLKQHALPRLILGQGSK